MLQKGEKSFNIINRLRYGKCTHLCYIDGRQFETILSLNKTRDDKK